MTRELLAPVILATAFQLAAPVSLRDAAARSVHPFITSAAADGLRFEANLGQTHDGSSFVTRGRGYVVSLTPQKASFRFRSAGAAGMKFLGANPDASLAGEAPFSGRSHYFRGREPGEWVANVPNYRRVVGRDLYAGIDVIYYSRGKDLAFDLIVHPGANTEAVDLQFDGGQVAIDVSGNLVLDTLGGALKIGRPSVFEERGHERVPILADYELRGHNIVRFQLGVYDSSRALLIDPLMSYSTYLGGEGDDSARAVAVDADGAAFVTGSTESIGFPSTAGPATRAAGDSDAFVTKLSPSGELVYSVFLGGAGADRGEGIVVDGAGSAYVTGATASSDFPTRNAFQKTFGGNSDAFVVKLSPAGSTLEYATYLGGSDFDAARGAAVDADGNLVTMGQTQSVNFPTRHALQPEPGGAVDAFVAKLNAAGGLVFSTFLGGSGNDLPFYSQGVTQCEVGPTDSPGWAVAVDSRKFIHVAGTTESTDFPTANPLQAEHLGGLRDAFVSKFSPDGSQLVYSTYIGGSGGDSARGLAVDAFGNAYVTGGTKSPDFPVSTDAAQKTKSLDYDAFVLKLDPAGKHLLYSTFLGGSGADGGNAIGVDSRGNAFFVGHTTSTDFPLVDPLEDEAPNNSNLFFATADARGSSVPYSTYLGGVGEEGPCSLSMGIAVDPVGTVYVASTTSSTDFPVTSGAYQTTLAGQFDAFLTAFRSEPRIHLDVLREGDQNRLLLSVSNPGASRTVELKLWADSPTRTEQPRSLIATSVTLPPRLQPTRVLDTALPSDMEFPGTTVGSRVIDPGTGLVLDQSICRDSPCR